MVRLFGLLSLATVLLPLGAGAQCAGSISDLLRQEHSPEIEAMEQCDFVTDGFSKIGETGTAVIIERTSDACKSDFENRYLPSRGAKAFAISSASYSWIRDFDTVENAEHMALSRCNIAKAGDQPCKIIHSAPGASLTLANGVIITEQSKQLYQEYLEFDGPKLLVVGWGGNFSTRWNYEVSRDHSLDDALQACSRSALNILARVSCILVSENGVLTELPNGELPAPTQIGNVNGEWFDFD